MDLSEFTEDQLKELSSQLSRPNGEIGIQVAKTMNETNISMTLNAIQNLDIQPNVKVLEMGHGNAQHLVEILEKEKGVSYYGLEISKLMYEEAQTINSDYIESGQASFYLYDGKKIPFNENQFDRVFSVNTLYFWEEPKELFLDIFRVLKPGGRVCIAYVDPDFMKTLPFTKWGFEFYTEERVRHMISNTPFKIVAIPKHEEAVVSKLGKEVNRVFNILILEKEN
jgi:SAM-dependent methyltransferase